MIETAFHAFPPFFLYRRYHSPQAKIQLPNTHASVMVKASTPKVASPSTIWRFPPTSTPNKKGVPRLVML